MNLTARLDDPNMEAFASIVTSFKVSPSFTTPPPMRSFGKLYPVEYLLSWCSVVPGINLNRLSLAHPLFISPTAFPFAFGHIWEGMRVGQFTPVTR